MNHIKGGRPLLSHQEESRVCTVLVGVGVSRKLIFRAQKLSAAVCMRIVMRASMHACMHTHSHAHNLIYKKYTRRHARKRTHKHANTRANTSIFLHLAVHAHERTHARTRPHTYRNHTFSHARTHTYPTNDAHATKPSDATREQEVPHTAAYCNTLQHTPTHTATPETRCVFQGMYLAASRCNTLQLTATHCNTLQHTASHCNTHCNPLQHTATHWNTLYCCALDMLQLCARLGCILYLLFL